LHADTLCNPRELAAYGAEPDHTECLAAKLDRLPARPVTRNHTVVDRYDASSHSHCQHQSMLGYRNSRNTRGIHHRNAVPVSGREIDIIGSGPPN
jgi:hypothetical protein